LTSDEQQAPKGTRRPTRSFMADLAAIGAVWSAMNGLLSA
jgi:hypothetical protein